MTAPNTNDSGGTLDVAALMATLDDIDNAVGDLRDQIAAFDDSQNKKSSNKTSTSTKTTATGAGSAEAARRFGGA